MFFKQYIVEQFKSLKENRQGNILLFAVVFGTIGFTLVVGGVSSYAITEHRASVRKHKRELAFQIAEAGINYYRWHLAHDKEDYYDGQGEGTPGPYLHEYEDKDGNVIGYFELDITPPSVGSSVVTIESTGWHKDYPESKRKVKARVGFPSLTDYAFLTDTDVWIGDTEETHGKFHANGGIRFDGTGDAPVTSQLQNYTCQPHHGCYYETKSGVWGTGGPQDLWDYPTHEEDFDAVTVSLSDIKTQSQIDGIYLSSSGRQGWRLTFKANGTIDIRRIYSTRCYYAQSTSGASGNACIDIYYQYSANNYPMPANGYIYVEDDVWVDGVVNGKVTVGTKSGKDIIIHDDITYLEKNGEHILGLIASSDVLVPRNSPDDLEINGALLAKDGAVQRYYFSYNTKDTITVYGSIITGGVWTWSWTSGGYLTSGYENTNSTYDVNLTYNPPPGFPVGNEYNLITWEEVEID